jgi:GWxTD domain-containing protein
VLTFTVAFDPERIEVEVTDLRSEKKTVLGILRSDRMQGRARALLPTRTRTMGQGEISSLVFGTRTDSAGAAEAGDEASVHGSTAVFPNPTRFFGVGGAVFPVYFELYGLDATGELAPASAHRLRYRIFTPGEADLVTAEDHVQAGPGRAGRLQRFNVEGFPAGTYLLSVEIVSDSLETLAAAYGEFHVVWSELSWVRDEKTTLDEARVLLDPVEFEEFEARPPGERAAFMAALWERVDPTPGDGRNEAYAEYQRRLTRAGERYGGVEGGTLSDRGRVLIRFGDADEVMRMRVPGRKDTLEQWVKDEVVGSLGGIVDASDPRLIQFARRRFDENPAFEIWKYFGEGRPILPENAGAPRGMVFIFVDTSGVGVYHLEFTNVVGIL